MANPKKPSLIRIDELLQSSLSHLKLNDTFKVYPIWKNWAQIVGPAIASKTEAQYIQGSVLFVSVVNSVWMNELERQKNAILSKVAHFSPEIAINDIRFRIKKEAG